MKQEVINIIKYAGLYFNEVFLEFEVNECITFNSIEWRDPDILLHVIMEDMDIEILWEDLSDKQQEYVFKKIRLLVLN